MNINELNNAWIAAGQKVSDLNDEINTALLDDKVDVNEIKDMKTERDNAVAKRDMLKEQLTEARAAVKVIPVDSKTNKESEKTSAKHNGVVDFAKDIQDMAANNVANPVVKAALTETDSNGTQLGMVVPEDIDVRINKLIRQYASLQNYVRVEATSMPSGSRVYEKWADIKPLANLDDDAANIGANDDPQLTKITYNIHRYAGISTITNTLLNDSPDNLIAWVSEWIAHKVTVTRNQAILKVLPTLPGAKTPTLKTMDDVRKLIMTGVDPAIATTSIIMTNVSGFAALANLKDNVGRYYIDQNVAENNAMTILGKKVVVIADKWLPDVSGNHPFYYGDMSQAVTLFNRQQMSLLATNVGGTAFNTDTTQLRVIDRFDVEATDTEALVPATFSDTIAPASAKA